MTILCNSIGRRVLFLTIISLLAPCFVCDAAAQAKWTFMVYLDADNDLEQYGADDFLEMAQIGSTADVNIVVQFDRISGYDSSYGDWTTCKRFLVTKGLTPTAANALADLGEINMGDPRVLTDFIDWASSSYPADNYALVLWDHGTGWNQQVRAALEQSLAEAATDAEREAIRADMAALEKASKPYRAVCIDVTSGNDFLGTKELKGALDAAAVDMSLIGFDACLMGMMEVAYELRGTGAAVMVASEEVTPAEGWPYDNVLGYLSGYPPATPAALGAKIVDDCSAIGFWMMSALDLGRMSTLSQALNGLAAAMIDNWQTDEAAVKAAAGALMQEIGANVVRELHLPEHPGARGLAIYFPALRLGGDDTFDGDYNGAVIDLPADTLWDEFLAAYRSGMRDSFIDVARSRAQEFDDMTNVDLYDFCDRLVNPPLPCGRNYGTAEVPMNWEDISLTGQPLHLLDDDHAMVSLPFGFTFFCSSYQSLAIGSNGIVYFQNSGHDYANVCLPTGVQASVQTFIAPFWDDLNPEEGDAVYFEIRGTEPDRRAIIQWNAIPHWNIIPSIDTVTFQVVLYEKSHGILFQYQDAQFGDATLDWGASATVGIQENLISAVQYSCGDASLRDGQAILFSPLGPPDAPSAVSATDGTMAYKVRVTWSDVAWEKGYEIYRAEAPEGPFGDTPIAAVGADVTLYQDILACGGPTYYYKVVAYNDYGPSASSTVDGGSTGACPVNLVRNGSFESGTGAAAALWSGVRLLPGDGRITTKASTGIYSFRLVGASSVRSLVQTDYVTGRRGDALLLGGRSSATIPPGTAATRFLEATVYYRDGTRQAFRTYQPSTGTGWVYSQKILYPSKDYYKVTVRVFFSARNGRAWFDDVQLLRYPVKGG